MNETLRTAEEMIADAQKSRHSIMIRLPFPVSVNGMFPTQGKRRVRSPRYAKWATEAGWMLKEQKAPAIQGPVNIRIDLVAPDNRRRDAANLEKGVTDLLVSHGIIEADDQRIVRRVSIGWEDEGAPCTVLITAINREEAA